MDPLPHEELFRRLFVCGHVMEKALRREERFEEWTAIEILALRAFQRVPNQAMGASERLGDDECYIEAFARDVFRDFSPEDCRRLIALLGRALANLREQ